MNTESAKFEQVFKKSEHEEIMDKLKELERKIDGRPDLIPIVPYVLYVPPQCPCIHWGCPWGEPYPVIPYYPTYPIYYDDYSTTANVPLNEVFI